MPSHRPSSAFPFIFQELTRIAYRKSGTPITAKYPTVKCPMVRPQRYSTNRCRCFGRYLGAPTMMVWDEVTERILYLVPGNWYIWYDISPYAMYIPRTTSAPVCLMLSSVYIRGADPPISICSIIYTYVGEIYQVRFRPEMKPGPMIRRMSSMHTSSIAQQFNRVLVIGGNEARPQYLQ